MEIPSTNFEQIEQLSTWFFRKDRSNVLSPSTFLYLPAQIGYLSHAFISETILSANTGTVSFVNIPQSFRHLLLFVQSRSSAALEVDTLIMRFNNDSGANYDYSQVQNGTFAVIRGTTFAGGGFTEAANSRVNTFAFSSIVVPNYSVAGIEKYSYSYSGAFGDLSADADLFFTTFYSHWRNKNVITTLQLSPSTGPNFVTSSRFQLYGVL